MLASHTLRQSPRIEIIINICEIKMKTAIKPYHLKRQISKSTDNVNFLKRSIMQSWKKIAPFWPLKNLIAVNPLHGLEDLPIEQAIIEGANYFQQPKVPNPLEAINRETIKWMQVFFDEGQATITMPLREKGLYRAWQYNAQFDYKLHKNDPKKKQYLSSLPDCSEKSIARLLYDLGIPSENHTKFLTLILTTLPGWASYIKYRTGFQSYDDQHQKPVSQADYLAIRLIITYLLWPEAKELINWEHQVRNNEPSHYSSMETMNKNENGYRLALLKNIANQRVNNINEKVSAQLVFCIDVRSEPFRRALESTGIYETFGFAGFFGIPVQIKDSVLKDQYASCPVLLSAKHTIHKVADCSLKEQQKVNQRYNLLTTFKSFYQSLKYALVSPFALAEILGLTFGVWMGIRTFAPRLAYRIKMDGITAIHPPISYNYLIDDICFEDQCTYAENALRMMGLIDYFAPLVVLCGHGSTTENNAYATALDCGACAGRHGEANASILAKILNDINVRKVLSNKGIMIPKKTHFVSARHDTTTDEVTLYPTKQVDGLIQLKLDLKKATEINSQFRCKNLGVNINKMGSKHTMLRSQDWAQIRPEWGLARNAAFIVAPRALTKKLDLEGRCFLHSYDYRKDPLQLSLTTILTAPMIVANWINMQYLFSTLDNVAYGAGNKITKNITGKIGVMQGNASDLMTGLPLQSVYLSDKKPYHEIQRLLTVVYAPRSYIDNIISKEAGLQKLFQNGWVTLSCIEPFNQRYFILERDLTWQKVE